MNGNVSWLLIAAERFLLGGQFIEDIYETNPPLSVWIYTPHVLISWLLNVPLTTGALYTTTGFVILASALTNAILKSFTFISTPQRVVVILAFLISASILNSTYFAEREHLLILGLIPFILCQIILLEKIKVKKPILHLSMVLGTVLILVKPHYGLLPVIFMLYRAVKHKSVFAVFKADFWALFIGTLSYLAIIMIFFLPYVSTVLPDSINMYVGIRDPLATLYAIQFHLILYLGVFLLELFQKDLESKKRQLLLTLSFSSIVCLIPMIVQMKGFYNHLIPAYAFFTLGLSLSFAFRLQKFNRPIQILLPFIAIFFIINTITPYLAEYSTHKSIAQKPVGAYLTKHCKAPCSFFAFHGDIEIFNPTAAHMHINIASRFPAFWFLPSLINNQENTLALKDKYSEYVIQDFEKYRPDIIFIRKNIEITGTDTFDFMTFFEKDNRLSDLINTNYSKTDPLSFAKQDYFAGTSYGKDAAALVFDVYIKNK